MTMKVTIFWVQMPRDQVDNCIYVLENLLPSSTWASKTLVKYLPDKKVSPARRQESS